MSQKGWLESYKVGRRSFYCQTLEFLELLEGARRIARDAAQRGKT
jgi:hypothetical protein